MKKQISSFFSKAKDLGSKGVDAAKGGYSKAKQKTSNAIRDKKRQIAYEVLQETRGIVPNKVDYKFKRPMKQSSLLNEASNMVEEYYAEGGIVHLISDNATPKREISISENDILKESKKFFNSKNVSVKKIKSLGSTDYDKFIEFLYKKGYGNNKYANGGGVEDSFLHLYKLTYPDGHYIVESYDGYAMSPKEAMEKMRINIRGLKSYKYKGVSSNNDKYKEWYDRKDIGYSNTEAWEEVFENKYAKGGNTSAFNYEIGGL